MVASRCSLLKELDHSTSSHDDGEEKEREVEREAHCFVCPCA